MQLHRLEMVGIGPFVEPVQIDFDRLSTSGIFLMEGPTGAGKSTLIDAIVFALYGDVAGRASSAERMATMVAPRDVTPSVELEFSTSHGMFRIQRTPKHERSKRRGSGTTTEPASGKLWRLVSPDTPESGEIVSTRLDEIGAEIADIIGLSREQFVQTVVLPQGEFATFLRADAEHRRALLQRLFGTEVYDRTLERLVEMRRLARQQQAAAATTVLGSVRSYCGAAGLSRDDEDALTDLLENDPDQLLVAVQQQLDALATAAKAADAHLTTATQRATEARAAVAESQRRERAKQRVIELRERLAALDAGAAELSAEMHRLELADQAAPIAPMLAGVTAAQSRADSAQRTLDDARRALPADDVPSEQWAERERDASTQAAELAPLVDAEKKLPAAAEALRNLVKEHDAASRQRTKLGKQLDAAPSAIESLQAQREKAQAVLATAKPAADALTAAQRVLTAALQLHGVTAQVDEARTGRDRARRSAQRALKREATLRSRFIDSMAGHLADELEAGEPCPVCGSKKHPQPATPTDGDVTRADVEAAEEASATAAESLATAVEQLAALEEKAAELRGLSGGVAVDEARAVVAAAEAAVTRSSEAAREVEVLDEKLRHSKADLAALRGRVESLDAELARQQATITASTESLREAEQQVAKAKGAHASVADRVLALKAEASSWRAAVAALRLAENAAADVVHRCRELESAIAKSPFATSDEAARAVLDVEAREALRTSIDRRRVERVQCEAELASPELLAVDVTERVNVAAATEAAEQAEADLKAAQSQCAQLQQRLAESSARADEVQTALAAQRAVEVATASVIRMADLAAATSADNAKSMSLPTFVLRERFVEVVASANHRLAAMSDGRYQLEHVEDRRGNRKSGLELQVRDSHAQNPRNPATLSGGETFYCSLSLALGLADVVTAEAGGVDLGTLFVDEGFGSLDPDTLEQVLGVLQGLANSGRTVGVVSHVPELKEQIAERVSVIPNRDGSSRLIVAA